MGRVWGNPRLAGDTSIVGGGGGGGLLLTTTSLSNAVVGSAYTAALSATGGSGSGYKFSVVSAMPNTGLWMKVSPGGTVFGTPQMNETSTFIFQVTDSAGNTAQKTLSHTTTVTGSLAIINGGTLPAWPLNGYGAFQLLASGGVPPYLWSGLWVQPTQIAMDGWAVGTPTSATTITATASVTDSVGTIATASISIPVNSTMVIGGVDSTLGQVTMPDVAQNAAYQAQVVAYGGSGSGHTWSIISGALPVGLSLNSSTGQITGTATASGNCTAVAKCVDSASNSATAVLYFNVSSDTSVTRPSYNTSSAFFVKGTRLYDPNGKWFPFRGTDLAHYNSPNAYLGGAAVQRIFNSGYDNPTFSETMQSGAVPNSINKGVVPIVTLAGAPTALVTANFTSGSNTITVTSVAWGTIGSGNSIYPQGISGVPFAPTVTFGTGTGGTGTYTTSGAASTTTGSSTFYCFNGATSGNTSLATLEACGQWWLDMYSNMLPYMDQIMINIANEWGGYVGTVTGAQWQSTYNTVIASLRAKGYTCPFVVDGMQYGENVANTLTYGPGITSADPLQNVIHSMHQYGSGYLASPISNITVNSSTQVTVTVSVVGSGNPYLNQSGSIPGPYKPFDAGYGATIQFEGLSGALGTLLNGVIGTVNNTAGGSSGAWTFPVIDLPSASYPAYSGGGIAWDSQFYTLRAQTIQTCLNAGLCCMVGEFSGMGLNSTTCGLGHQICAWEAYQIPWVQWAWDDTNGNAWNGLGSVVGTSPNPATTSWQGQWQESASAGNTYSLSNPTVLTSPGLDGVLNPRYGTFYRGVFAPSMI